MKREIRSLLLDEIEEYILGIGEKKFRAKQLFGWISKGIVTFDEASNLPLKLREHLERDFYISNIDILEEYVSEKDNTRKYLFELNDGNIIEGVLMKYKHGYSICLSTQIGCRMGCTFCASTIGGIERNLTSGEIFGQIVAVERKMGIRISNIVLMGSGEPLDNYDNVLKFLRLVNSKDGYNLGMRNITLSTCGIVPKIFKLADEKLQITLAISLHSGNDDERSNIMPVNVKYPLEELIEACRYYIEETGRRITFEYALINGINDNYEKAKELGFLLKGMLCHVNLIPINKVVERNYDPAKEDAIEKFKKTLESFGITTTVRRELGSDINAACGQLRKSYKEKHE